MRKTSKQEVRCCADLGNALCENNLLDVATNTTNETSQYVIIISAFLKLEVQFLILSALPKQTNKHNEEETVKRCILSFLWKFSRQGS